MSTGNGSLSVGGIDVDVIYKDIKHLHIGVYPPLGRVRVAAPRRLEEDHIRLAVIERLAWIRRQQSQLQAVSRQSAREMVTGESHYVWGVRRRLRVIERPGRSHVELDGERLLLYVPANTDTARRQRLLRDWQRAQLRAAIPPLLERWEPMIEQSVERWTVRRMKTRWGSCNREARRISFNLELCTKHPECLEYVVVHELVHLLVRGHGAPFIRLMDRFLPDWRRRRAALNNAPLADERWTVPAS